MEENEAVGMSCCELSVRWVGGTYREAHIVVGIDIHHGPSDFIKDEGRVMCL